MTTASTSSTASSVSMLGLPKLSWTNLLLLPAMAAPLRLPVIMLLVVPAWSVLLAAMVAPSRLVVATAFHSLVLVTEVKVVTVVMVPVVMVVPGSLVRLPQLRELKQFPLEAVKQLDVVCDCRRD